MTLFSIIIPMYNRERYIHRAIASCLIQSFEDFEIIVVDDGSTDRSVDVVQTFEDSRIRLIKHETNQERLIARNTGAMAAKGEWLIWFDSDDELVPEALAIMNKRVEDLPSDVLGFRFMHRLDSGRISPDPPYFDEVWDYEAYIRWIESHNGKRADAMPVVHSKTIRSAIFPEDPLFTGEMQYHLDFAFHFRIRACTDVLGLCHQDADDNSRNPNIGKMLGAAGLAAARLKRILSLHGNALERWAPKTYGRVVCGMITQLLLSGQRREAWEAFPQTLRLKPHDPRIWFIMALGMMSPTLLAHGKAHWHKVRTSRTL
jgi:glycosyltransferase involved in cell wall biosynthesis